MRLPANRFEWITVALVAVVAAIFLLMMMGWQALAHTTIWRAETSDPQILDFQRWENPKSRAGCCGEDDCRPIDSGLIVWGSDAVSFVHDKTGQPKRYWIPRDEIDGSPNQTTYGCVVGSGNAAEHPEFPGQRRARCLMLSGGT